MIIVVTVAMLACLGIGYLIGWLCHSDRPERIAYQAAYPVAAAPRHAVSLPLRLRHVAPGTDELAALNAAATARFPALEAQAPLGRLVKPGRATDFIEKMKADTDRWIAANVEGSNA